MTSTYRSNLPASVRQRLLNLSKGRKQPFDLVLVSYGIERLLYRLSCSRYAEKFVLKGAMLFAIRVRSADAHFAISGHPL